MSPSPAGFNPFSIAMSRMTGSNGGGFIAEQRRMQFMLGMTHLQHQLGEASADAGLERQKALYSHQKEVDHELGMKRDTHQSELKINEDWAGVEQQKKKEQNSANTEVSKERRLRKLPLDREAAAERRAKTKQINLQAQRTEGINEREAAKGDLELKKLEMEADQQRQMAPLLQQVVASLMSGGAAPGGQAPQQPQQPQQPRATMPRYGSSNGNKTMPRRIRNKAR